MEVSETEFREDLMMKPEDARLLTKHDYRKSVYGIRRPTRESAHAWRLHDELRPTASSLPSFHHKATRATATHSNGGFEIAANSATTAPLRVKNPP